MYSREFVMYCTLLCQIPHQWSRSYSTWKRINLIGLVILFAKELGGGVGAALKEAIETLSLRVELNHSKHLHLVFSEQRLCLTHHAATIYIYN